MSELLNQEESTEEQDKPDFIDNAALTIEAQIIDGRTLAGWMKAFSLVMPENPDYINVKTSQTRNCNMFNACLTIYNKLNTELNRIKIKEKKMLDTKKYEYLKRPDIKTAVKAESMAKEAVRELTYERMRGEMLVEFFQNELNRIRYTGDKYDKVGMMMMSEMKNISRG